MSYAHYVIDGIGIVGVLLVVMAYFLITSQKLHGDDMRYHLMNFIGACLIMVSLWFNWNTPSVIIEGVWIAISSYGLMRCWLKKKQRS